MFVDYTKNGCYKQGCVLTPIVFGIFFAILLKHPFQNATYLESSYLRTGLDGNYWHQINLTA
jgi:hypothetical protein